MIFKKKNCPNCSEAVKDEWEFCPHCGVAIKEKTREEPFENIFGESFGNIFQGIDKELRRIDKTHDFDEDFLKFKPGISIIVSSSGMKPKIFVRTPNGSKKLEQELKRKLGAEPVVKERKKIRRMPKATEEPETEIKTVGNKQIISIKLPGVKSRDDVEVNKLEQSIEVKAFAGNKAYFKLIPIPANAALNKKFENGALKLEIEK